jgi:hypothetical protein
MQHNLTMKLSLYKRIVQDIESQISPGDDPNLQIYKRSKANDYRYGIPNRWNETRKEIDE